MPLLKALEILGFNSYFGQAAQITMILFNIVTVPKLIKKVKQRIQELQDPKVNESYSKISKYIYRMVKFQEIYMCICISLFVGLIIWVEIEYADIDFNVKELNEINDKKLWIVFYSFACIINFLSVTNDLLLIM